jgi:hypothetical protein
MLLSNGKRIIIKVKADTVSKKKTGRRQTRCPGRDDAQQTTQRKSQRTQTSGQETQTGLGTKTNR